MRYNTNRTNRRGEDMFISIDFGSDIPIYEQIKRQIVLGINKGQLKEGEVLPSVRQLGTDIGVNLHTVNKAYKELQNMGYVVIDRRVGTMISDKIPKLNGKEMENYLNEIEFLVADWVNRGGSKDELHNIIENMLNAPEGR